MINWKKLISRIVLGILFVLFICGLSFGVVGLIVKGICWAFKLTFSWRMAFGVWLVMMLVSSIFSGTKSIKGDN